MKQFFDYRIGQNLRDLVAFGMIFVINGPFLRSEFTGLWVPHGPDVGMAKNTLQPLPHSASGNGLFLTPRRKRCQKRHLCFVKEHQQLRNGIANRQYLHPTMEYLS